MFATGQHLSAEAAATLNRIVAEWRQYGFPVSVTSWPLTVHREGRAGQIIGIDPKAFAPPATPEPDADYPVNFCPELTADGCPTGRWWVTWADDEGNTTCELTECDMCVGEAPEGCFDSGAAPLDSPVFTGNPTAPTPSAGDNDTSIATTAFVTAAVSAALPVGTVAMWLTATPPTDWLLLDGSSFSAGTYPALNTLLGGTTLPDMRGRSPMGAGTGSGLTARTLGTNYGSETHTLSTAEMPAHTHKIAASVAGASGGAVTVIGGAGDATTTSTGSGAAHANLHPVLAVNFIIKAK